MTTTYIFACNTCHHFYDKPGKCKWEFNPFTICSGTLEPFFSVSDLTEYVDSRIQWIKDNIKKDCDQKTEVLFELESLRTALTEGVK